MKYRVNDNCIGCGMCANICPEVFYITDMGTAQAVEFDTNLDSAEEAMESCPVTAIEEE